MTDTAGGKTRAKRGVKLFAFVPNSIQFLKESVAELRRVVWPTRPQVSTYTAVVLIFVVIMSVLVSLIDVIAGRGVLFIFGN